MHYRKILLFCLVLLLIGRAIIPQLDSLVESIEVLKGADIGWVLLGIVLYFCGIPVLATQFTVLSFKKLAFATTLLVQGSTLFANKILPSGVGTISVNFYYLVKKKHTPNEATAVITINTLTSTAAYMVLIIASLLLGTFSLDGIVGGADIPLNAIFFMLLLIIGAIITLLHSKNVKSKVHTSWSMFKQNIATYKQRPRSVLIATIFNGMGTSLNILTLILSAKAIGVDISFANALLAYTFGNVAAALVPTPGGLGSAEMGIYSGLMLAGLNTTEALSITLLYRFISYWLPILPGYLCLWKLRKGIFSDFKLKPASNN